MSQNINLTTTESIEATFPEKYFTRRLMTDLKKQAVFYQLATKYPMPAGNGKTMQARKSHGWDADETPLQEGVTPAGRSLNITEVLIPVQQFGEWVGISDFADKTSFDNLTAIAADELTELENDRLEVLNVGAVKKATHVIYPALSGTVATAMSQITAGHMLTSLEIRKAVRDLKKRNAKPFVRDGKKYFKCIIDADAEFLLQDDKDWKAVSEYQQAEKIENGEIGKLYGAIVIVTPFPMEWKGENLTAASRNLTVKTTLESAGKIVAVKEAITTAEATALVGRKIILNGTVYTLASAAAGDANAATITTTANVATTDAVADKVIYPGEGGAAGTAVRGACVIGDNALGNTDIEGSSNLSMYYNPAGGAGDPLHQRKSVAVKIMAFGAGIVDNDRMVMIKHGIAV